MNAHDGLQEAKVLHHYIPGGGGRRYPLPVRASSLKWPGGTGMPHRWWLFPYDAGQSFARMCVMLALLCFAACALAASPEEAPVETSERPVHLNHLIQETSPYLLQHAHNPVEWYPWGEEALAKAKAEDKPIFLSIGYSACHWCHVMAHESFESEGIAAIMNEHFVNVKVDREERPDLDEIYMAATVAMSGSGGWPMSVWLTPDLKPFYCGTYFPPEDRFGRPGFPRVLEGIAIAWNTRREDVLKNAEGLTAHITQQMTATGPAPQAPTAALMENAYAQLTRTFDAEEGGWGNAPKFPNSGAILLLLRAYHRNGDAKLLHMATHTLDKMARGGMYDQLGGGFHRYSVDGEWLVPHFEKMLYDNAQLAVAYLEAYQATGNAFYRQVVIETLDYVLRDLRDAGGGFHSAEDADSEGEEGKFYVWTALEIESVLGADAAAVFNHYYAIQYKGNFESHEPYHAGQNIPHVTGDVAATAAALGSTRGGRGGILGGIPRGLVRAPRQAGPAASRRQGVDLLECAGDQRLRAGGRGAGRAALPGRGGGGGTFPAAAHGARWPDPARPPRGAQPAAGLSRRLRLHGECVCGSV
jgi:hypothetical protein